MKFFHRLFRFTLRAWPRRFRAQHGPQALRMASRRVREESGPRRIARAAGELIDLLWTAPRIRWDMRDTVTADLRFAWRSLARTRGFLVAAITTLGAAMALCVCVMALVNVYLVKGLPYPESDRLYTLRFGQPGGRFIQGLEKLDWRALDDVIEQPIAWDLDLFNLRGAPYPEAAQGTWVTTGYMEGFGVRPAIGRAFTPSDFAAGAPTVALISHRLWQTRFGGAADIVGRQFEAHTNDRPNEAQTFTIVGVLPRDLWHLNVFTEVMAPLRAPSYPYMARLQRGVTPEMASQRISALVRSGVPNLPADWQAGLESAHADYVRQIRPLLTAMAIATALVMLIACANVAVLFTVRATHRQRETAVRKALGASAGRIVRALAAEALVLGAAATAVGLVVAHLVLRTSGPLLERFLGRTVPGGAAALRIDATILLAALAAGLFVVVVCCAAQLWTAGKASLTMALTGGQKGASNEPNQRRAHAALIAVEVAASLTLLVGAALTIQSGLRILNVPMGLDTRDVVVSRLNLSQQKYPNAASRNAFFDRVAAEVRASGARQVAYASSWPLQAPPPRDLGRDGEAGFSTRGGVMAVSEEFFTALTIPIEDGRAFDARDVAGAERVAVVSRTLASRLWPGTRALGQRLRMAPQQGAAANQPPSTFVVIGIAGDVRDNHADQELADMYVAFQQYPSPGPFVYVRAGGAIGKVERDLRNVVAAADADMAIGAPRLLSDILGQQRAGPQFLTTILVIFALLAALLALVGVYGVIAFTVRQREREIAVRVAIGADRRRIVRLFLGQGARVLGIGLVAGMAGAVLLGRVLETQLFNVRAVDPLAIGAVAIGFGACGLAAVAWPAFAAAAVDPASALKDS